MGEVRVRGAGSSEVPVVLESGVGGGDLLLHYDAEACRLAGIDAPEGVVLASNDRAGELRLSVARAEAAGPAVLRVGFTGSSLPSVELTGLVFGVEGERLSAVDSRLAQPKVWSLRGYPNPFNPAVTLRYELGEAGEVQLVIYDVSGAMVRRLVSGWQGAGGYAVVWDGRDEGAQAVASGLYLGCLESGSVRQVHKLMLLK
jgi:hypothetical protein